MTLGERRGQGGMRGIRRVRADEWKAVRDLRIESLSDPLAPIAFLDTRDRRGHAEPAGSELRMTLARA